jgi:hypothetical protein
MSNPPPPSKNRENQDSATMTQAQPSTSEEVEARAGRPAVVDPGASGSGGAPAGGAGRRRDGDRFDQADRATDDDVAERARPGPSHLDDSAS